MWRDLSAAVALLLILEGILPFANPRGMRRMWLMMVQMDDRSLRAAGLISMGLGLILLNWVR